MIDPMDLHEHAMELLDQANGVKGLVSAEESANLLERALLVETEAADLLRDSSLANVRGVVHKSAIALAIRSKQWILAEKLLNQAKQGETGECFQEDFRAQEEIIRKANLDLRDIKFGRELSINDTGAGTSLISLASIAQSTRSSIHKEFSGTSQGVHPILQPPA